MLKRVFALLTGLLLVTAPARAQDQSVQGKVTSEAGQPMSGVQVVVKGTTNGVLTNAEGHYAIRARTGQVLQYRFIGHAPVEKTIGTELEINVTLKRVASQLDAMVVTALGQQTNKRSLGTSQQTVVGPELAQTQRENFINALQGRVAGVEVTSSSGVPGASSSITIRGVSSISSSNQPLMIVDGLPIDNKTFNTGQLASDAPGSTTAFSNRGLDFTNRSADINPEDIETLTVLKGPEASALYGIDAANGAIVITTKRGRAGLGGFEYSNTFRVEDVRTTPNLQQTYGPTSVTGDQLGTFQYFGAPYAPGTQFYNNIDGFFQTAMTARHNLSFSGAAADNRVNYRLALTESKQEGVVPNTQNNRVSITGASQAQVTRWLRTDLSMAYSYQNNQQPWKGADGPLIGLMVWPQTDNASDWLTPAGTRRRITLQAAGSETDNPYFNVNRNINTQKTNRLITNLGFVLTPFTWGSLKTNIGIDGYTSEYQVLRHPESAFAVANNGILDLATDVVRNINMQSVFNVERRQLWGDFSITGLIGNQVSDFSSNTNGLKGTNFLDPNFVSMNNTSTRQNRTVIARRRLISMFGSATLDYKNYAYVTVTGRNDWTSTIPTDRNSFFYPSISSAFVVSDAFPALQQWMTAKVRVAYAEVGKDARPYAFRPSLESKLTTGGGYGYGFTGPNLALKPEFARSYEGGFDLTFLDDRLGVEATWYRKRTKDQIVNDIRGSYATGFILFNLNGAETSNYGTEITLRGTPVLTDRWSWDAIVNFDHSWGWTKSLPNALPESYVSDTWLYGNVRNGTAAGLSTRSLTGLFYLRNTRGDILIDPTTGLPLRSSTFIDAGYDRTPDFTIGVTNNFTYGRWQLSFLFDIRKGGDILNATEHFLTSRGLSERTLDREQPRVIRGVLRDGRENSANPTPNNIVVIPAVQPAYYTAISEELFIEKDINWLRLRDITVRYEIPARWLRARSASVFVTGTDLFLLTNYSGLDPIVNGNTAAVGGSGGQGIDYGNFPIPRGISFGLKVGY
ncbi:MAG: SusC/RagA family TonB-linked outer membrane protein [Gemmatimonadaceae bacterium]|nr:SusC/RagA family TonB-linked outer membrane protein [Gemmatimonadaceae bacterium]